MTTFFVVAGFFARLMVYRRGLPAFIKDRRKRILIPLLISWPILMVLMSAAIIWGMTRGGKPFAPPPPTGEHVLLPFAWAHLWFLYVLLLLYATVLGVRWLANTAIDRDGVLRRAMDLVIDKFTRIPLVPIFLAVPVGVSLYFTEWWNFWMGIPTPDSSIIPNLAAFVGYGTAITFGWFLHRHAHVLRTLERYWLGYFTAAAALTVMCYSMVGMPATRIQLDPAQRAIYSGAYSVAIWCWTFAIIGAATRFLSGESKVRRYLADSSYWMYIMHMPLICALQALMMQWPIHWSIKYSLILSITFAVLLVTYHYWVRPTKIGEVLNGRRYSIAKVEPASLQLGR